MRQRRWDEFGKEVKICYSEQQSSLESEAHRDVRELQLIFSRISLRANAHMFEDLISCGDVAKLCCCICFFFFVCVCVCPTCLFIAKKKSQIQNCLCVHIGMKVMIRISRKNNSMYLWSQSSQIPPNCILHPPYFAFHFILLFSKRKKIHLSASCSADSVYIFVHFLFLTWAQMHIFPPFAVTLTHLSLWLCSAA